VVASLLAGGLGASVAVAVDDFDDVDPESQFAEHVENISEAGIATGYPDGTFRPREPINRQQAAAWINRSATRSALDFANEPSEYAPVNPGDPTRVLATVTVTSPAAGTGGGWVNLQGIIAAGTQNSTGAGCPCAIDARVHDSDGDDVAIAFMTVPGEESDDERDGAGPVGIAPVTGIVYLPAGETETYTLEITLDDDDVAGVFVSGVLSAQYTPMAEGDPAVHGESVPADEVESLAPGRP
jgi:hypothetical protein